MRISLLVLAAYGIAFVNAAENAIDFPPVQNDITFEQVQELKFRLEDKQLSYGENPLQYGKLYLPESTLTPYPLIIFIHGGCWLNSFDMSHTYPFLTGIVQAGIAVWSLEYRRSGDYGGGWPGTYEDIKAGINYVNSLEQYGVDKDNFLIIGHSAGGHLALLAGTETSTASGVIAIAPISNIITYSQGSNTCQAAATQFMGSSYNQNSLAYRQANPAEKTPHNDTLIFHGTLDDIVPIEQSHLAGAHTELLEGASHFDWIHPGSAGFKRILISAKGLLE